MDTTHQDFYRSLRQKITGFMRTPDGHAHPWAKYLMAAPDLFYLLFQLVKDPRVAVADKAKLLLAITYFISPFDFIPEMILGPGAYVDDVAFAAAALSGLIHGTQRSVIEEHWPGDQDALGVIESILNSAQQMLGTGTWAKIRSILARR